jgi:hypothetical protein
MDPATDARTQFFVTFMNKLVRCTALILIGLSIAFGVGCKKKEKAATETSAASNPTPNLPGAADVTAALDKKDYEGTMAALVKVRQTVTTSDEQLQYTILSAQVKDKLLLAAPTDPKAAEALAALRIMTSGR